jgi:glycosyltransferase involved in cell wall biosynthesis
MRDLRQPAPLRDGMRILIFYCWELGNLGGVEAILLQLAEAYQRRGCVAGIVETAPRWKPKRLLPSGIPVWGVRSASVPSVGRPRSWASFLYSMAQFEAIVIKFRPDIVHVHYPGAQTRPVVGAYSLPHRWRLAVTLHGSDIRVSPNSSPQLRPWLDRLFRRADVVTAVSGALMAEAASMFPSLAKKSAIIPNFVSGGFGQASDHSDPGEKFVLYVGRFHQVKGVDLLLRAWKEVWPHVKDTQLWLAGDGPESANLRSLTSELGLASSVVFLGPKDQKELPALYRRAQLVVLPSRSEGSPLTLLEAGTSGALCVGTRVPGIAEIIENGVTGFMAEPESSEDLAGTMLRVLQLPEEEKQRIKQAARARVQERYSEDGVVEAYLRLFGLMLESGRG